MTPSTIETILKSVLPQQTYIEVDTYKGFAGTYTKIMFAAADVLINNVRGQRPQAVSLSLLIDEMELTVQCYGGNGGQHIYRNPNLEDPKEKYLAMKSVKIPFRKPQPNEVAIEKAIIKFAQNWLKALNENKQELRYKDIVDYTPFLT
jgi:hypothetical protein